MRERRQNLAKSKNILVLFDFSAAQFEPGSLTAARP
jgi:hypothetical protein